MTPRGAALLLAALAAPPAHALQLTLSAASIRLPGQEEPITQARLACTLGGSLQALRCSQGQARAHWRGQALTASFTASTAPGGDWALRDVDLRSAALQVQGEARHDGRLERVKLAGTLTDLAWLVPLLPAPEGLTLKGAASFELQAQRGAGRWSAQGVLQASGLGTAEASGRYASEALRLDLGFDARGDGAVTQARLEAAAPQGQAYAEPLFVDFTPAPARAQAALRWTPATQTLAVEHFALDQPAVVQARGSALVVAGKPQEADIELQQVQLGPAYASYALPFVAGTRLEQLSLSGRAQGSLSLRQGAPQRLHLRLEDAGLESSAPDASLGGLEGTLAWSAQPGTATQLSWNGGHIAKLALGAGELHARADARNLALLAPLRLPLAGGALVVRELAIEHAGQEDMAARFDAEIEPLDLGQLCEALGWPKFGGSLGGRLPGLQLRDGELSLAGALTARAFDGEITVDGLRVLEAFGRVPRLMADLRLRNLDLTALTSAFSFGRIDGRLDGDVQQLRLLDGQPVAFKARLQTPPGDRSPHRISQRAIDSISSVGGGPSGVLSRGALRFFKDFAYARIGWSCELRDGVCHMDGLKPADDGGYVLVEGRLLPRIDVVGYQHEVDWSTFVEQLQAARGAQNVEVR